MKPYMRLVSFGAALMMGMGGSYAATQGTLGSTSQGSLTISVTKTVQAQITDISDMTLANWSINDGAVSLTSNICVYSSTGSYTVKATGSGTGSIFTISNGSNIILYTVNWDSGGAGGLGSSSSALLTTVPSLTLHNANTTSATCGGGGASNDTARVTVGITSLLMTAAPASATAYTGTLTLLITPV